MKTPGRNPRRAGRHAGETANSARVTERFPVAELDCAHCGDTVRAAMRRLPGVQAVAPNVAGREVAITFDPQRLSPATIRAQLDALDLGEG